MSNFEGLAPLWSAQLAVAFAVATVLVLRRPCRRWFGAERAFLLWLLPPVALLASQWPHPAHAGFFVLPGAMRWIAEGPSITAASSPIGTRWQAIAWITWMSGASIILASAFRAQQAYERHLRLASPYVTPDGRWRVLRAATSSIGPAMVGAWRPTIVVPVDFEERYPEDERALVLAHEITHAERRDGLWALCALVLGAFCWPTVLAPWALRVFRLDQELACDARVLRCLAVRRRSYALAMLKTPVAMLALPSGCSWSSRHPLTERIAMLNSPLPGPFARRASLVATIAIGAAVSGLVYAAAGPAASRQTSSPSEYQLDISVDVSRDGNARRHGSRAQLALCVKPGEKGSVGVREWSLDATVTPKDADHVRMVLGLKDGGGAALATVDLQGTLGSTLHESGMARDGASRYIIDVAPHPGCPARDHSRAASTG
jgi:beta-lactamase regulating signal transducer with metallopeptidase domain